MTDHERLQILLMANAMIEEVIDNYGIDVALMIFSFALGRVAARAELDVEEYRELMAGNLKSWQEIYCSQSKPQ